MELEFKCLLVDKEKDIEKYKINISRNIIWDENRRALLKEIYENKDTELIYIGIQESLQLSKEELALELLYEMSFKIGKQKNRYWDPIKSNKSFYDGECCRERENLRSAYKLWVKINDEVSKRKYLKSKVNYKNLIIEKKGIL